MWVAAATYCAMLAPKSLLATLIGVLGMAHFSLGKCFLETVVMKIVLSIVFFNLNLYTTSLLLRLS